MTAWLLSIAGIVVVGALVDVLLSDSSVHKFVRSIYAFFVLFVIVQPLPGFFRDTLEVSGSIELDTELMERINAQTTTALQRNAQLALESAGYNGIIVTIHPGAVYINALGSNTNNRQDIIKIVRTVTNVSEEVIHYVGR